MRNELQKLHLSDGPQSRVVVNDQTPMFSLCPLERLSTGRELIFRLLCAGRIDRMRERTKKDSGFSGLCLPITGWH